MKSTKNHFAKPLDNFVKFVTAIRLTAMKYRHGRQGSVLPIMMALCYERVEDLNAYQKIAVSKFFFGKEKSEEVVNFFLDRYEDEAGLINFLNKEVTFRYFRAEKGKRDKTAANAAVKKILNEHLTAFLGDDVF